MEYYYGIIPVRQDYLRRSYGGVLAHDTASIDGYTRIVNGKKVYVKPYKRFYDRVDDAVRGIKTGTSNIGKGISRATTSASAGYREGFAGRSAPIVNKNRRFASNVGYAAGRVAGTGARVGRDFKSGYALGRSGDDYKKVTNFSQDVGYLAGRGVRAVSDTAGRIGKAVNTKVGQIKEKASNAATAVKDFFGNLYNNTIGKLISGGKKVIETGKAVISNAKLGLSVGSNTRSGNDKLNKAGYQYGRNTAEMRTGRNTGYDLGYNIGKLYSGARQGLNNAGKAIRSAPGNARTAVTGAVDSAGRAIRRPVNDAISGYSGASKGLNSNYASNPAMKVGYGVGQAVKAVSGAYEGVRRGVEGTITKRNKKRTGRK